MSDAAPPVQPGPLPTESISAPPSVIPAAAPRLRLWPAVVILAVEWLVLNVPGWLAPGTALQINCMLWGAMGGSAAIIVWWLFASRAPWSDRLLVLLFLAAASVAAIPLYHPKFNYRLYGPIIRALPLATWALVLWLLLTPWLRWPIRRAGILVAIVLALGYCNLLRFHGADGNFTADVRWRWEPTAEDAYLKKLPARQAALPAGETPPQLQPGDWPGFRGPNRDGRLTGVRLATDWQKHPPRQLWKHGIGPGWSSFAVVGNWLYTQEQRGPNEMVVCYDAATGEQRWAHGDSVRFDEAVAGPGPRATPTFHEGRLYSLGASGVLNCLDAATGAPKWTKNILTDSGREKPPEWGFSSSPLVAKGVVTVFAGGPNGKGVLGYDADSGKLLWGVATGKESYCSPHLVRTGGAEQVVIATSQGLTAFDPAGGKLLWQHEWAHQGPPRCAQPTPVGDADFLLGTPLAGMRRVHVTPQGDGWGDKKVWETRAIRPYFNDLVVYQDHAYGFDGNNLTCVRLADGKGRWRASGYGSGQVLLLADQGVLLVVSEKGDVALVEASPQRHEELARIAVFEGKTWNHPVVAHGKLFVRNDEEVACYQLTAAGTE
jgi:outer membrane protein assembly factor BamB